MEQASKCIQQRMRSLSERPHTDVLEYAYDSQERGADAVTCVKLFQRVLEIRQRLGAGVSDAASREAVLEEDPSLKDFSKNFPAIFKNALNLEHGLQHLVVLKKLARLRKEVESRNMTEAEANVHATRIILDQTMRAPTESEKQEHGL